MSNGLGAGFAGLMLLAVLLGLATLQTLALLGVLFCRVRSGSVPRLLAYVSATALLCVGVVAGFAVVALYDEAIRLAALFVTLVWIPLVAVGFSLHRGTGVNRLDTVAVTGLSWGLPFVAGVVVVFGIVIGGGRVLGVTGRSQRVWMATVATAIGGFVVLVGAASLGKRVSAAFGP